ncbi:MAG: tetratricopeptide repeat protein, partial [Thermoanaerobaculia bacterium]
QASGPAGVQAFERPETAEELPTAQAEPPPAEPNEAPPVVERPMVRREEEREPTHAESDLTATLTMADLYSRQGYVTAAREIYERILATDPGNVAVRQRLSALPLGDAQSPEVRRRETVQRLEKWLTRVARHEGRHV